MKPTTTRSSPGEHSSLEAILRGLYTLRRRRVLFHLRQNGSATVDDLVDIVATEPSDGTVTEERLPARSLLIHVELPVLEELNLVTVDAEENIVRLTADTDELGKWLDLAVQHDVRVEHLEAENDEGYARRLRVLVVDDDAAMTDLIERYFASKHPDISVTTETKVEDAVTTIRDHSFDCIVSDWQMPAISGLDFLKVIREEAPEMPFLLFTARGSQRVASEAIENNVTGYVIKTGEPDQFEALANTIHAAVGDESTNTPAGCPSSPGGQ